MKSCNFCGAKFGLVRKYLSGWCWSKQFCSNRCREDYIRSLRRKHWLLFLAAGMQTILLVFHPPPIKAEPTRQYTERIILHIKACSLEFKDRCQTFKMSDAGSVEHCQDEAFDVTDAEWGNRHDPMTKERCQMGGFLQAFIGLIPAGIQPCATFCEIEKVWNPIEARQ